MTEGEVSDVFGCVSSSSVMPLACHLPLAGEDFSLDGYPRYGAGRPFKHDTNMDKVDALIETMDPYRFDICTNEIEPDG